MNERCMAGISITFLLGVSLVLTESNCILKSNYCHFGNAPLARVQVGCLSRRVREKGGERARSHRGGSDGVTAGQGKGGRALFRTGSHGLLVDTSVVSH